MLQVVACCLALCHVMLVSLQVKKRRPRRTQAEVELERMSVAAGNVTLGRMLSTDAADETDAIVKGTGNFFERLGAKP